MFKSKQNIILLSLILFSSYSAITLGQTWDEDHLSKQGEIALNYLFSLGRIDEYIFRREYYSPIYYSLKYLFLQSFPIKYQFEVNHLINLAFSICQAMWGLLIFETMYPLRNDIIGRDIARNNIAWVSLLILTSTGFILSSRDTENNGPLRS